MANGVTKVNPKFGRRQWVKLWVNEWLEGTTRIEMSDAQRAFWVDLLALAGRSRFPGKVCSGMIDGQIAGYPIQKYQALMTTPIDVEETLALFEKRGKIKITVTAEEPTKLIMVELVNWNRYQSEYLRQKKYRTKLHESDTDSYSKGNTTEVEGEVEVEVNTTTYDVADWILAFPGIEVETELEKAKQWLKANPTRAKKNLKRFFFNWLSKCHRDLLAVQAKELVQRDQHRVDARVGQDKREGGVWVDGKKVV
jgi:hypothetical protein